MTDIINFALIVLIALSFQKHFEDRKLTKRLKALLDEDEAAWEEAARIAEQFDFGPERTERDSARNAISRIIAKRIRDRAALSEQQP